MRSMTRIGLLSAFATAATTVAVLVIAVPAAQAAAPPDITPVKVAATRIGEGHAVYVRGTDARLYWRTVEAFAAPGYSTDWRALPGGTVGSGPDALQVAPTTVLLAAKANDLSLLVRQQNGTAFGGWLNLGGKITTAPALLHDQATSRIWVFARGGDGAVWYRVRSAAGGTWAPWASIGGIVTSAPDAIVTTGEPLLAVRARGLNGNEYIRALSLTTGVWEPWEHIGFAINSATSTVHADDTFQIQYWRGANRHVFAFAGDSGPADIGGVVTSAPDASFGGEVVAAVGTNRALYVHTDNAWRSLGGITA
jgi:hypothetical protein